MSSIYIIGSLRNDQIPIVGNGLRARGWEVFDDWFAAGPEADDHWQSYEKFVGRSYGQALKGRAARNTFRFDYANLHRADAGLLVMPAGKSGHLELGFIVGLGKPGYILFDKEPDRWDVMYCFAKQVFFSHKEMYDCLKP